MLATHRTRRALATALLLLSACRDGPAFKSGSPHGTKPSHCGQRHTVGRIIWARAMGWESRSSLWGEPYPRLVGANSRWLGRAEFEHHRRGHGPMHDVSPGKRERGAHSAGRVST